jgi:NAD(P)-dependent dehydrogenase (short-subunit alcohol dehydrogenase family)
MDLSLNGKTALVTGSSRGTGLIIAAHLAREGATVYVHGLEPGQAQAAVDDIGVGIPVKGDIRTDAGAAMLFGELPRALDILVNNYGAASRGSWSALDADAWIEAYQTNVLSAQRCVRALLPAMQERGWGRIVNLGTVGSTRPAERMPHYYAAKGALATMTVSLAKAVAGSGVTVNLVSPGLIRTPEVEAAWLERGVREGLGDTFEAIEPQLAQDIPIRRIARREEVADLVAFLVSPLAGAIHGQNIRIDGGALGTVT